jgi:prepilin-type N-terminal cleavage/methylation domain-containing protein
MIMKKNIRGFTLVETMVAIAILTIAVAGPLYTADRAVVAAEIANNQLTASYLAQEGIEYVRMVRDNSYLSAYQNNPVTATSVGWANFTGSIAPLCSTSCQFDPANGSTPLVACSGSSCSSLYLSPTNVYTQQSSNGSTSYTPTPYARTIQVVPTSSTEEKVISTVSWNFHGTSYSETIIDHLTPWQ